MQTPQPCGAIRVVRWFEGQSQVEAWCSRTCGPCPYPGAGSNIFRNGRACVVEFAQLNPQLVSEDYHDRGHASMFPEWCATCAAECSEEPPATPPPVYALLDLNEGGR